MSSSCRLLRWILPVALLLGSVGIVSAQAMPKPKPQHRGQESGPEQQSERNRRRSDLSDSVRRIERETQGQVLSAERLQYDGRELNRVKVLDGDGRIRVYVDDPSRRDRANARTRGDDDGQPNL